MLILKRLVKVDIKVSALHIRLLFTLLYSVVLTACNQADTLNADLEAKTIYSQVSILVGTYTSNEGSKGIYAFDYDPNTYTFSAVKLSVEVSNPSFGVYNNVNQRFYSIGETSAGSVMSYAWDHEKKQLHGINTLLSEGVHPCHIALSPSQKKLAVANYSSGNIAIYDIDAVNGSIKKSPKMFQHKGKGLDKKRQEGPHAHWVSWSPDGRYLYAVDLGVDKVYMYPVDTLTEEVMVKQVAITMPAGSGPRHMVFHPTKPFSYILNELTNTLTVTTMQKSGHLSSIQNIKTLPEEFKGQSQAAHIGVSADGNYIYTTNRGHNSIAVFSVASDGKLTRIQEISTEGQWPRFFMLLADGKSLLVANQESNNIVAFTIGQDGMLSNTGNTLSISKPVYLTEVN